MSEVPEGPLRLDETTTLKQFLDHVDGHLEDLAPEFKSLGTPVVIWIPDPLPGHKRKIKVYAPVKDRAGLFAPVKLTVAP